MILILGRHGQPAPLRKPRTFHYNDVSETATARHPSTPAPTSATQHSSQAKPTHQAPPPVASQPSQQPGVNFMNPLLFMNNGEAK